MSPIIQWLLAKSQTQKTAWSPPGSVPAVSYNTGIGSAPQAVAAKPPVATQSGPKPQTSGSMAKDTLDSVLARGGGNGWKAPGTVPAVSYNTGLGAPAEPIAARPPVATQSGPKPAAPSFSAKKPVSQTRPAKPVDAKPAMLQSEQALHPSDQAKQILAQLNQRRRDAAFGRGSLSSAEDKAMEAQAKKLLGQSNTMRNAPGYKPDAKSMHPRDQADVVRQRLNNMRSAAGGEVAQSGKMLRQLDQLGAAADAMPVPKMPGKALPGKSSPRPAGPAPTPRRSIPEPMLAKVSSATSAAFRFGAYIAQLS